MAWLPLICGILLSGAGAAFVPLASRPSFYLAARAAATLIAALVLLLAARTVTPYLGRDRFFLMLVAWAGLSILWTPDVAAGALAVGTLAAATILGALLASLPTQQVGLLVMQLTTGLSAISLILFLALPQFGALQPSDVAAGQQGVVGALNGVFSWNAEMGAVAGVGAVVSLALITRQGGSPPLVATLAVNVAALTLSGSATAIVATVAAALVVILGFRSTSAALQVLRVFTFATLVAVLPILLGLDLAGAALELLGKDDTLTGRTAIWDVTLRRSAEFFFIGTGMAGFWALPGTYAYSAVTSLGFNPGHAHNGLIETFLNLGVVGLLLISLSIVGTITRLLRAATAGQHEAAVLTAVLVVFLGMNIGNNFVIAGHLMVALYVWVSLTLRAASPADISAEPVTQPAPSSLSR